MQKMKQQQQHASVDGGGSDYEAKPNSRKRSVYVFRVEDLSSGNLPPAGKKGIRQDLVVVLGDKIEMLVVALKHKPMEIDPDNPYEFIGGISEVRSADNEGGLFDITVFLKLKVCICT